MFRQPFLWALNWKTWLCKIKAEPCSTRKNLKRYKKYEPQYIKTILQPVKWF